MADLPQTKRQVMAASFQAPDVQSATLSAVDRLSRFANRTVAQVGQARKQELAGEMAQATVTLSQNNTRILNQIADDPSPDSGKNYDKLFGASVTGQRKTISKDNLDKFDALTSEYARRGQNVTYGLARKSSQNILQENFLEAYNTRFKDAKISSRQGEVVTTKTGKPVLDKDGNPVPMSAKPVSDLNQMIQDAVSSNLISGSYGANLYKSTHDEVEQQTYLGQFDKVLQGGDLEKTAKFIQSLNDNKKIDPQLKASLIPQFKKMEADALTGAGITLSNLKEDVKGVNEQIRDGDVNINDPKTSQLLDRLQIAGSKSVQTTKNQFAISQQFHDMSQLAWSLTPQQMEQKIQELDKKTDNPQQAFIQSQVKTQMMQFMNKRHNMLFGKNSDPRAAVNESPTVINAVKARKVAAFNEDGEKSQGTNIPDISITKAALTAQRAMNVPADQTRVFTNSQIESIRGDINNLVDEQGRPDIDSRLNYVSNLYNSLPQYTDKINRELSLKNVGEGLMDLANLPESSAKYAKYAYMGLSNAKELKSEKGLGKNESYNAFFKQAKSTLAPLDKTIDPTQIEFKNNLASRVALVGMALHQSGVHSALAISDATKLAYKTLYANKYSVIDKQARVPIEVPVDTAKTAMKAMEKHIPNTEFNRLGTYKLDTKEIADEDKKQDENTIRAGYWKTITGDKGLYWTTLLPNNREIIPTIKGTNKRYEIRWDDLSDPSSDVNKTMAVYTAGSNFKLLHKSLSEITKEKGLI
jgi:hypothetical protein